MRQITLNLVNCKQVLVRKFWAHNSLDWKTLFRVPTDMGLCTGKSLQLGAWKKPTTTGVNVHHILCFSEAWSKTLQSSALEGHHLPPNCRSEGIKMYFQWQKKEREFHWAVKRDGQSAGSEPVLLRSLCDFNTSQFPGTTLVYLARVWCLDDTGSVKLWHKNSGFSILALPMVRLGNLQTANF